jgi:hypothetical protein
MDFFFFLRRKTIGIKKIKNKQHEQTPHMDGSDVEDEFNGEEEEEEDFDFGDGSVEDGDDYDDEPNPSLSMLGVDEDLANQGMKSFKIIAFDDIIESQQAKVAKIHEVLVKTLTPLSASTFNYF